MGVKDTYISKNDVNSPFKEELWDRRFPHNPDASELVLAVSPDDYSASRIASAVEDCNAHLLNLNLTHLRTDKGYLVVDLRVNHCNSGSVVRSLERYGFQVLGFENSAGDDREELRAQERAEELLRILNL